MSRLTNDFIQAGTRNAQENTWNNRYNSVIPSIKKDGNKIILSSAHETVELDSFDEIILTIIIKFLFAPVWLLKQFYNTWMIAGLDDPEEKINSWVNIGLVWKEAAVTGQYVRPTYLLFKLFGQDPEKFYNIPFNTLTHTISEEQVMFEVMSGRGPIGEAILKREKVKLLPRISELGFDENNNGTNIITECDFRNPALFKDEGIKELNDTEHKINEGMRNGETVTPELEKFNQFVLVKKINNTGTIKKDFVFHIADLIIPTIRNNGKPQSIAIEVELTNKRAVNYEETMKRYKDNNKYGAVYWLCNTPDIANNLREAYSTVGGTGTCRTILLEFTIPTPSF